MPNSLEYYLSKGFDRRMAEYFAGGRRTITAVVPQNDYKLLLTFDNHEQRLFDMKPLLKSETVFAPLADINIFNRVYLDDTHAVSWDKDPNIDSLKVWQNKIDICPDTCYVESIPF